MEKSIKVISIQSSELSKYKTPVNCHPSQNVGYYAQRSPLWTSPIITSSFLPPQHNYLELLIFACFPKILLMESYSMYDFASHFFHSTLFLEEFIYIMAHSCRLSIFIVTYFFFFLQNYHSCIFYY